MQITITKDSRSEMFVQVLLPEIEQMFQVYVERQRLLKSSSRVPSAQSINLLHTFPLILVKNKM